MEFWTDTDSPLGRLTLASDGHALTGLWMEDQKYFGSSCTHWTKRDDLAVFVQTKAWLAAYFSAAAPLPPAPPLAPEGTDFQRRVWRQLLTIPYGETITYGALAAALNCACARAMGGAVGRNPISLIIPCHRVVGADGKLTGYAGGVARKRWLLDHERTNRTNTTCQDRGKYIFTEKNGEMDCVCGERTL